MAIKSLKLHVQVTPQDCSWKTGEKLVKDIVDDASKKDYDEVCIDVTDISNNRETVKTGAVFNGGTVHNQYNNNYVSMS